MHVQYDKNGPYHVNFLHFLHLVEVWFVGFGQFSDYEFVALRGLVIPVYNSSHPLELAACAWHRARGRNILD